MKTVLTVAIQKSGKLHHASINLFTSLGIEFDMQSDDLRTTATNFPLQIFFLRDDDIPQCVASGLSDIGIVGHNVLLEKEKQVSIEKHLGFGQCRLSIAVPAHHAYGGVHDLEGTRIATSYPKILATYLKESDVNAHIHEMSGSVEIAPSINLADAICDLVSSGRTLHNNNLREVEVILESEAVLIAHHGIPVAQRAILARLLSQMEAPKKKKVVKKNYTSSVHEMIAHRTFTD